MLRLIVLHTYFIWAYTNLLAIDMNGVIADFNAKMEKDDIYCGTIIKHSNLPTTQTDNRQIHFPNGNQELPYIDPQHSTIITITYERQELVPKK